MRLGRHGQLRCFVQMPEGHRGRLFFGRYGWSGCKGNLSYLNESMERRRRFETYLIHNMDVAIPSSRGKLTITKT